MGGTAKQIPRIEYPSRPFVSDEAIEEGGALGRWKGARRDRRLAADVLHEHGKVQTADEERQLLAHASPWMPNLIVAALETGCRRGELLSLQWRDVDLARSELRVRPEKAKTREGHHPDLAAVPGRARHGEIGSGW